MEERGDIGPSKQHTNLGCGVYCPKKPEKLLFVAASKYAEQNCCDSVNWSKQIVEDKFDMYIYARVGLCLGGYCRSCTQWLIA